MKQNSAFSKALTPILAASLVISFSLAVNAATESVSAKEIENTAATVEVEINEGASKSAVLEIAKEKFQEVQTFTMAKREDTADKQIVEEVEGVIEENVEDTTIAADTEEIVTMPKTGPEPKEVPLYNQLDYSKTPYGGGTVATSGCGITCAAMAISYFNDVPVFPDELAPQFNNRRYSNLTRMEQALEAYGISYQKEFSWGAVHNALQNGQLVISLQEVGIFTNAQHFILLTGLSECGKVFVNDPYGYNYVTSWELSDGFANGFDAYKIHSTASGYWILSTENASN